jgi:hypothetical protein
MNEKKRNIVLLFFFSFFSICHAQNGEWTVAGSMKYPVAAAQIVFNNSETKPKFYFFGGINKEWKTPVNWIQEYDLSTSAWSYSQIMNSARSSFFAGFWNSTTVCFGGASETSSDKNALESWDLKIADNAVVSDSNINFNRRLTNAHIKDDYLYILGGIKDTTEVSDSFYSIVHYNLKEKKVDYADNLSSVSNTTDNMSFMTNDKIYLLGGEYDDLIKKHIITYSVSEKSAQTRTEVLTKPRAGGAAIYLSDKNSAFVVGGYDQVNKALNTVDSIKINTDGTIEVLTFASLKYSRKYPMLGYYNNKLYVFGGFDEQNNVVAEVEVFDFTPQVTSVNEETVPSDFLLYQNYPNPFNPTTNLKFSLPKEANVSLKIYNTLGEEVAFLINQVMSAGNHIIEFNGSKLSSGIYFYKIDAGGFIQTKKMLLIK